MRRITVMLAFALALFIVGSAPAIEVNSVTIQDGSSVFGAMPAGVQFIYSPTYTSAYDIPKGLMAWTGDGSDFWFEAKVGTGETTAAVEGNTLRMAKRIPSYMLIPISVSYDSTLADGSKVWKCGAYINSPDDSLFYYWTK